VSARHPNERFNLNLFIKKGDGGVASESTVGRYRFSANEYCDWIIYTIRKDLDKPGVTNEAPPVTDHCTPVVSKMDDSSFSPAGEGVEVSHGQRGAPQESALSSQIIGQGSASWESARKTQ
jgi:hypothetical protein